MKKLVPAALLVAGLSASLLVGATSVSWAQETPPSCAQAISAFLDARNAFEKLPKNIENPDLVKLAEAVEEATETRDERKDALDALRAASSDGDQSVGTSRDAVKARIKAIEDFIAAPPPADKGDAKQRLADRNAELKAIDTLASAETALTNATEAQRKAPRRIDNPALKAGKEFDALAKTQNAADTACEGQPNDPGPATRVVTRLPAPPTSNAPADNDNGFTSNSGAASVFTPVGGVETGGGPA